MSRKKKAMRAFLFQNPDATRVECWDAAWANEQSRVSSLKHQELERVIELKDEAIAGLMEAESELEAENARLLDRIGELEKLGGEG